MYSYPCDMVGIPPVLGGRGHWYQKVNHFDSQGESCPVDAGGESRWCWRWITLILVLNNATLILILNHGDAAPESRWCLCQWKWIKQKAELLPYKYKKRMEEHYVCPDGLVVQCSSTSSGVMSSSLASGGDLIFTQNIKYSWFRTCITVIQEEHHRDSGHELLWAPWAEFTSWITVILLLVWVPLS